MGHRSQAEWWWVMMWCAVLVALAVLIWPGNKSGRLYRLAYRGRAVDSAAINEPRYAGSPRVGVAQVITSAIARIAKVAAHWLKHSRNNPADASPLSALLVERLITVFEQRRLPDESPAQVNLKLHAGSPPQRF